MRILQGSGEGIVSGNESDVKIAVSWLAGSNVETALRDLGAAEERLVMAQKELLALKKKLARVLAG
jgi:hypothetical protein